ncbi:MAG TPA: DUF2357 domain-containing protein, partial [Myxococcaceae bacterium]|nr:DUF2357 domain-containing protein [Myxococcaceae bacterium]
AREGWRCWLDGVELELSPKGFPLRTKYWAGTLPLLLRTPEEELRFELHVLPRAEKLSGEAWAVLLRDLDRWLQGSTVGQERGLHGGVGLSGAHVPGVAAVLGELVPAFVSALEDVLKGPRERAVEHWTEAPLHAVRQADAGTLRHLARHPDTWQRVRGQAEEGGEGRQALVPQRAWRGHLDHPANRYVAWLVREVVHVLRAVVRRVEKAAKRQALDPELERWCVYRAASLTEGADALEVLLRRSSLGALTPEPASEAAFLTLLDDPVYARVHRLGQLFREPRFQLSEEDADTAAPVRPTYELYELWTFFRLREVLAEEWPGAEWTQEGVEALRLFDENARGAHYTARWPGRGTLRLYFNLSFPSFLARKRSPHWSISVNRRPDLVVTWQPEQGQARWLCLDAKYRTEARNVADAFESAHLYRDSLRWEGFGEKGRCEGAVLLVPAMDPKAAPWFESSFRDEHGVGAFLLTPGHSSATELLQWLGERLGWEQTSGR